MDERIAAADDYKQKARGADDNAANLRTKLAGLTPPEPAPTVLPPGTTADLGDAAVALAALARCEAEGSDALHQALARLIVDLRTNITPFAVEVSFSLRLPTTGGPLLLGPATFVLPNTRKINKAARLAAMVDFYFLQGLSWDVIGQRVTRAPELAQSQVRKHLAETFPELSAGARTAILNCPIAETRRVVWHALTGTGAVDHLPAAWVAHVKDIYLTAMPRRKGWAHDSHDLRRAVITHILTNQIDPEDGVLVSEIATATGYSVHRITRLTEPTASTTGMDYQPSYERVPDSTWGPSRATKESRIRARMCPWCGTRTATHPLRVPECPDDLICTACHRMPSDPNIVFPAEYLEPWPVPTEQQFGDDAGPEAALEEAPVAWKMRRQRATPDPFASAGPDEALAGT